MGVAQGLRDNFSFANMQLIPASWDENAAGQFAHRAFFRAEPMVPRALWTPGDQYGRDRSKE